MVRNRSKLFYILILPFLLLVLNGCTVALIGAGAAGALVVSQDGVSTYIDSDVSSIWRLSSEVLRQSGQILESDRKSGTIKAIVKNSKVKVLIEEVTSKTVKLKVKARKNLLPNVELAHDLATKILERLN